jgi:hypothetical protein
MAFGNLLGKLMSYLFTGFGKAEASSQADSGAYASILRAVLSNLLKSA